MLSIQEDDDAIHRTTIVARGNGNASSNVPAVATSKKLSVYREFDAPTDDDKENARGRRENANRSSRPSRRRRAPAATYGDWFDGDDAELEKMVDEFQNEQQENVRDVGDRVRESVAELCGALDELIEEEDAISNNRSSGPSLREQLVDSWQGKSYYERLQNVVDADAEQKKKKKNASLSSARHGADAQLQRTKHPLSSINLNSANYNADGKQKKPSSISLLQPLYKNQNYMIPQKALDVSRSATPKPPSGARTQLSNVLAELTKLAVPTRKDERAAIRGDLLRIVEVCQKKLAACATDFPAEDR